MLPFSCKMKLVAKTYVWAGILKQGLRIAPPEGKSSYSRWLRSYSNRCPEQLLSPVCWGATYIGMTLTYNQGYMFGKGVYFADVSAEACG